MKESFIKYLGAILVIIAAIILICSYFIGWTNINWVRFGALALMIVGILLQIFLNKRD